MISSYSFLLSLSSLGSLPLLQGWFYLVLLRRAGGGGMQTLCRSDLSRNVLSCLVSGLTSGSKAVADGVVGFLQLQPGTIVDGQNSISSRG